VVTEHAPHELSEVLTAPGRGSLMNTTERLAVALQVARGVADVHHGLEPTGQTSLVHNDLNLANLRVTKDGRPVLNDFNIAQLLMRDRKTGGACPFASRFPNPQWRSPEEQVYSQEETDHRPPVVTEKIDVYALGNILYRLAVGSSPWKKADGSKMTVDEKLEVARKKKEAGQTPDVPASVVEQAMTDPSLRVLLDAVDRCFQLHPDDRPTAIEVVRILSQEPRAAMAEVRTRMG
jgi:serine/threonine protein kinase